MIKLAVSLAAALGAAWLVALSLLTFAPVIAPGSTAAFAAGSCANLPYIFTNGTVFDANQLNADLIQLQGCINATLTVTGLPAEATTTGLAGLVSTAAQTVARTGYYAPGDSPQVFYTVGASPAACTLNAGAGDGFSQIPSFDSKCWNIIPVQSGNYDIRDAGAVPVLTAAGTLTANQTAINAVQAYTRTVGGATYVPSAVGPFNLPCTNPGIASSGTCVTVQNGDLIVGDRIGGIGSGGSDTLPSELHAMINVDGLAQAPYCAGAFGGPPCTGPETTRSNNPSFANLRISGVAYLGGSTNRSAGAHWGYGTGWRFENVTVSGFSTCWEADYTINGGGGQGTITAPICDQQEGLANPATGYPSFGFWSHGANGQTQGENIYGGSFFPQQIQRQFTFAGSTPASTFSINLGSGLWLWSAKGVRVYVSNVLQNPQSAYTLQDITSGSSPIYETTVLSTVTAGSNAVTVGSNAGLPTGGYTCAGSGVYPCTPAMWVTGRGIPPGTYVSAMSGANITLANAEGLTPYQSGSFPLTFAEIDVFGGGGSANEASVSLNRVALTSNAGKIIQVTFASPQVPTTVLIKWNDPTGICGYWMEVGSDNHFKGQEVGSYDTLYCGGAGDTGQNVFHPSYVQITNRVFDDWSTEGDDIQFPLSSPSTVINEGSFGQATTTGHLNILGYDNHHTNPVNSFICGDLTNCPWQDGVTFTGIGATPVYVAGNWFAYGSAATAIKVIDGDGGAVQVQRPSTRTDTDPECTAQILSNARSRYLTGGAVELSAAVDAGANFSGGTVNVVMAYGTVAGESSTLFSTGGWTGYTEVLNLQVPVNGPRMAWQVLLPAGPNYQELGVKFCQTPAGTAGANDWFYVEGPQIEPGYAPSPQETLDPAEEGLLAREWYQSSYATGTAPGAVSGVGADLDIFQTASAVTLSHVIRFEPRMVCGSPVDTLFSPGTGTAGQAALSTGGSGDTGSTILSGSAGNQGFAWTPGALTEALGTTISQQWTADCRP